jgi:DNA recombination protein RmuC
MDLTSVFIGGTIGLLAGWLLAGSRARHAQAALHAALLEARSKLAAGEARTQERALSTERERVLFASQIKEMKLQFESLATKVLDKTREGLLDATTERMKPLTKELERLHKETLAMEEKRAKAYGAIGKELESLQSATALFTETSTALTTALRGSSKARGDFGEMSLHNIVKFAGMTEHCDFLEQKKTADGSQPDLIVKLPGDGLIPIDAKFPLAAYWDANTTDDPKQQAIHLRQHAKDMRAHVRELTRRDYASQLDGNVDYTVMFLPGDHLLAAAFEVTPTLQEDAIAQRILIATPVTLVALLRTVGLYWKQQDLADNAREIHLHAEELHERIATFVHHLAKVGRHLEQAQGTYNEAVASYESRVLPAGRRLEALNATKSELPELIPAAKPMRELKQTPENAELFEDLPKET